MVLKTMTGKSGILLIVIMITVIFSCEKPGIIVNCEECLANEPVETDLVIKLSPVNFDQVEVIIYEGNLEDDVIYSSFFTSYSEEKVTVMLNKQYTVTARYIRNGKTFIAVDSALPRVKYDKYSCDEPCFFIYDRNINVALKRSAD